MTGILRQEDTKLPPHPAIRADVLKVACDEREPDEILAAEVWRYCAVQYVIGLVCSAILVVLALGLFAFCYYNGQHDTREGWSIAMGFGGVLTLTGLVLGGFFAAWTAKAVYAPNLFVSCEIKDRQIRISRK